MDKIVAKLREVTSDNTELLVATFFATMLGTLAASTFLIWATAGVGELEWVRRLVAGLGATLIYGGTAAGVFYVFVPDSREAFKKVWQRLK